MSHPHILRFFLNVGFVSLIWRVSFSIVFNYSTYCTDNILPDKKDELSRIKIPRSEDKKTVKKTKESEKIEETKK